MVNLIRLVLLAGSVIFGAVVWYLVSSGQMTPSMEEGVSSVLRYVFFGFVAVHFVGIALVRQRAGSAETFSQRARLLIVGYALAEGLVLFGGVYMLLTGSAVLFLGGLLVFLVAFFLLPIEPPADA